MDLKGVNGLDIKTITAQDLYRRMKLGHNVVLIDVRTTREFERKHIAGSTTYPLEGFNAQALINRVRAPFPTLPTLYLICSTGALSREAAKRLADANYEYITIVDGGMKAWNKERLPTIKRESIPTTVHSLEIRQQMQLAVGLAVTLGTLLGTFVNTGFLGISLLAGVGYAYEGIFGTDYLKQFLLGMPWNQEGESEPSFFRKLPY